MQLQGPDGRIQKGTKHSSFSSQSWTNLMEALAKKMTVACKQPACGGARGSTLVAEEADSKQPC